MLIRFASFIRFIVRLIFASGRSFEILADAFEACGDPFVSVEILVVLVVLWWRGNVSHLILATTIIAIISIETGSEVRIEPLDVLGRVSSFFGR